jgi:steroid Delta-isomerase
MSAQALPSTPEIQALITRYFAATRAMDVEAYLDTFAEDAIDHDPVGGTPMQGHAEIRPFFEGIVSRCEAIGLTEEYVHIVGNEIAVKWRGEGVSQTGRKVTFEGIDLFEINTMGKIQTLRAYWNPAPLIAELTAN